MGKINKRPMKITDENNNDIFHKNHPIEGSQMSCERECKVWRMRVKKVNQKIRKLEKKFLEWTKSENNNEGTNEENAQAVQLPPEVLIRKNCLENKRVKFRKILIEAMEKLDEKIILEKLGKFKL